MDSGQKPPRTDERRVWTNLYVQFGLPQSDRAALEALLVSRGSSLGEEFRQSLVRLLEECGADPANLAGPGDEDGRGHHH